MIETFKNGIYYHKTNEVIQITFDNKWIKKADYLKLTYSSLYESYAIFFYDSNQNQPIIRVYNDDINTLNTILYTAITKEILDLSNYYQFDSTDFK